MPKFLFANLPLKIIALFFAFSLWVMAVLDRMYEVTIPVPVVVSEKGRLERVITDVSLKNVEVTVTGKGKELFRLRRKKLEFHPVIPEGRFGTRQIKLNPADLKLPEGITIRSIEPEMIEVKLGPAFSKPVAVVVPTKGELGKETTLSRILVKTVVNLIGPADEIDSYDTVRTETLNLSGIPTQGSRWLKVLPPKKGFSCTPESVEVEVVLEQTKARIFLGVPVKVIAPPTTEVIIEPREAQLAIAGPVKVVDSLRLEDITLTIKIANLSPGTYRLGADVSLPQGVRLIKCEPELFQITIR